MRGCWMGLAAAGVLLGAGCPSDPEVVNRPICGPTTCPAGEVCCDAACGLCAPPGAACPACPMDGGQGDAGGATDAGDASADAGPAVDSGAPADAGGLDSGPAPTDAGYSGACTPTDRAEIAMNNFGAGGSASYRAFVDQQVAGCAFVGPFDKAECVAQTRERSGNRVSRACTDCFYDHGQCFFTNGCQINCPGLDCVTSCICGEVRSECGCASSPAPSCIGILEGCTGIDFSEC